MPVQERYPIINVNRATASSGPYTKIASTNAPGYVDEAVGNGVTYYYVISAVNAAGQSPNSAQVSAMPMWTPPTAPYFGFDHFFFAFSDNGQVELMWSPSDGTTSYNIKRSTVSGGPYDLVGEVSGGNYNI